MCQENILYEDADVVRLEAALVHELLKRAPVKAGIRLYLSLHQIESATAGELIDVLGRAPRTVDNALRDLRRTGQVEEREGRFYLVQTP